MHSVQANLLFIHICAAHDEQQICWKHILEERHGTKMLPDDVPLKVENHIIIISAVTHSIAQETLIIIKVVLNILHTLCIFLCTFTM